MDFGNVWGDVPSSPPKQPPTRSISPEILNQFSSISLDDAVEEQHRSSLDFPTFSANNESNAVAGPSTSGIQGDTFSSSDDGGGFEDPFDAHDPGDDDFGGFDDGFTSAPVQAEGNGDDDFGDFGEFDEAPVEESFDSFGQSQFGLPPEPGPSQWKPLRLDPLPSQEQLSHDVEALLKPIFGHLNPDEIMTSDPIRQVEGIGQILSTPESRAFYDQLCPPTDSPLSPFNRYPTPNWTRSRIRRAQLISLGIPVNLDEVLPAQPASKAPPLLEISTRPMSAPPGKSNGRSPVFRSGLRDSASHVGTPQRSPERDDPSPRGRHRSKPSYGLGPKPQIDRDRIEAELNLDPDRLSLLPVATLEAHLSSLRSLTASTSELLSHLLQTHDGLQQESDGYNNKIKDLVSEATKAKMGGATSRKSSMKMKNRGSTAN